MSVNLPQGNSFSLPDVPNGINAETREYLMSLRRNLIVALGKLVDNDTTLQSAINTGATGTFVTTGAGFVFVNGILTSTV